MAKAEAPNKFFWLDLETTGLEPERGDRILEVAALITDIGLNEIGTYDSLITHKENEIKAALAANPFWASRPEETRQIIADMKNGRPEAEVQASLVDLVNKSFSANEPVYMAGNTIRLDRSFIDHWMPDLAARLHYRMMDVSSFKLWWTANGKPEYQKQEKHRALDDIRESIAELKLYNQDISF